LFEMSAREPHPQFTSSRRPHLQASQMTTLRKTLWALDNSRIKYVMLHVHNH